MTRFQIFSVKVYAVDSYCSKIFLSCFGSVLINIKIIEIITTDD